MIVNTANISDCVMVKKKGGTIEYGATKKTKQIQENNESRPVPKTGAERTRECRARKKAAQQLNQQDIIENAEQNSAAVDDINGS